MDENPKSFVLSSARRPNGEDFSTKYNRGNLKVGEDCSTKFNRGNLKVGEDFSTKFNRGNLKVGEDFSTKFNRGNSTKVGESRVKAISSALSTANGRHSGKTSDQQFYFGQNLNSLVKMSPFLEKQSTFEKFKMNKTLNHPPKSKGESSSSFLNGRYQRATKEDDLRKDESAKNGSFGSAMSSYSSMFSSKLKNGGSRFYDDENQEDNDNAFLERPLKPVEPSSHFSNCKKYLAPKLASCLSPKAEKSQDEIIKEFEAELV